MRNVITASIKDRDAMMFAINSRTNGKSKDRIRSWLKGHGFLVNRFENSDMLRFIERCPLSSDKKALTIHNPKPNGMELVLVLKEQGATLCFKLEKTDEGFIIKHTSEKAWVFNKRGNLIKRIEHKKVKIWLEGHNLSSNSDSPCDLVEFISSCPLCHSDKPLRFHRSTEDSLDLQCGCINYFRIRKETDRYLITRRSEILGAFDLTGKRIVNVDGLKIKRRPRRA